MKKVTVTLSDGLERFVRHRAREGGHASAGEYLRSLVDSESRRIAERKRRLAELRQELQVGVDQLERGEIGTLSLGELKAEGRRRLAQKHS
ncbi:MAG: hypothetical protein M5U26_23960 [Planctomycetota bacterium]|nr:hypothetical protein [Planctomycetota bacterium]